jgi:hypothetical protein
MVKVSQRTEAQKLQSCKLSRGGKLENMFPSFFKIKKRPTCFKTSSTWGLATWAGSSALGLAVAAGASTASTTGTSTAGASTTGISTAGTSTAEAGAAGAAISAGISTLAGTCLILTRKNCVQFIQVQRITKNIDDSHVSDGHGGDKSNANCSNQKLHGSMKVLAVKRLVEVSKGNMSSRISIIYFFSFRT